MEFSFSEYVKIIEEIQEKDPQLIETIYNRIKKVDPHYRYLFTLTNVLQTYCEKRNLKYNSNNDHELRGRNISKDLKQERFVFIAVALLLFSPNTFTVGKRVKKGHKEFKRHTAPIYKAEGGIRHHLSGILGCHENVISNLVNQIACRYHERNTDFKEAIDGLAALIKDQVKEEIVEIEQIEQEQ